MKQSATLLLAAVIAPLFASVSLAQQTCNVTNHCGDSAPCCSDFGFCDSKFCRGGCNPLKSFAPTSCSPNPRCESKTYTFTDTSRIVNATDFNGNVTKYDWTLDNAAAAMNQYIGVSNGALALYLTQTNKGARISTTRYMYYGRATAKMQVGKWNGVVVTFIGMSDAHDEIDWEWPGTKSAQQGQSNFFWLGVVDPKGGYHDIGQDGAANYNDYSIDWSPDRLIWAINGKTVRTLNRADTLDQSTGQYKYPASPMRLQFSIWPAGIPGTPQGTIDWSGGMINWNDADYKAAGHFYAQVKQLTVQCLEDGALAPPADTLSYVYGANTSANIPAISFSNRSAMDAAPGQYISGLSSLMPLVAALAVAIGASFM